MSEPTSRPARTQAPPHSRSRRGRAPRRAAARAGVALLALAATVLTGACSSTKPIAGTGDAGGRRLVVFASDRNQAIGQYDLYVWDFEELRFRTLSGVVNTTASERQPTISSDGRFIAFQSDRGLGTLDDILMYDRSNQSLVSLPGLNGSDRETEPVFTGDGLKLVYVQQVGPQRRVRFYDGQTKQLIPLPGLDTTGAAFSDYSPSPNRDGSVIAFVSTRNGNPDVFLYHRLLKRVLDVPELRSAGNDVDPYFSNNGRHLAFASDRAGGLGSYDLVLFQFDVQDTSELDVRAANSAFLERHPAINDAGNVLLFHSDRPDGVGRFDLWKFDRGTTAPAQDPGMSSTGDDIEPAVHWPF